MFIRRLALALLLSFAVFGGGVPVPVSAAGATTCECFCGVPKYGARSTGSFAKFSECTDSCSALKANVVACATDASQSPDNSPNCFTEEECTSQKGRFEKGSQPTECLPGEHYCYAVGAPAQLSVPISGVTSVRDYGAYINLVYKFLLGFMITVSIVMVMIGGLQYVLAGAGGDVKKAKGRIGNAVVGLILLLFSATILGAVNPQLLSLQPPQLPMIKPVEFVRGKSCEYLLGYYGSSKTPYGPPMFFATSPYAGKDGYTIENPTDGPEGAEVCGSFGEVIKDAQGNDVLAGTTCEYEYCSKPDTRCVGSGDKAKCLTCLEVYPDAVPGLIPSASICGALTKPPPAGAGDAGFTSCFFTHDPSIILQTSSYVAATGAGVLTVGSGGTAGAIAALITAYVSSDEASAIRHGTCAEVSVECAGINTCSDYENGVTVETHYTSNQLDDVWATGTLASPVNLQTVCSDDPCGAARKGGYDRCQYFPDGINNCLGVGGASGTSSTTEEPDLPPRPAGGRER